MEKAEYVMEPAAAATEAAAEPENLRVLVVLRREDLAFLDEYSQASGLHNRSAALRLILREWARVTGRAYGVEVEG